MTELQITRRFDLEDQACCAHLIIRYRTEQQQGGLTHGWWECDDCHSKIAPVVMRTEREGELELLAAHLERAYEHACNVIAQNWSPNHRWHDPAVVRATIWEDTESA